MPFGRVATSVTPCGLTSSPQRVKSRCSKVRLRRVQPGRYSSRPLPGRIPPEAFRAARRQAFRLLAQTVSEWICHRLRRSDSARLRHQRNTFVPAGGPSRPRPRRPSAHTLCRSLSGSGSLRSPSPCTAKARQPPHLPDRLRGHAPLASLVPRPMALADSQPPHQATATTSASVRLPAP